jgi:3-oxoacid CoA-transferase
MATLRGSAIISPARRTCTVTRPWLQLGTCTYKASARPVLPTTNVRHVRYSTATPQQQTLAPKIERGASKLFRNADEAVADLKSGSTILSSGFGLCGVAGKYLSNKKMGSTDKLTLLRYSSIGDQS